MPFIEVANLTKAFGSVIALKEVSLEVDSGAIVGIMGPNGAGKSTLLRILAGLVIPSQGVVRVGGVTPAKAPREFRRSIGFAAGERPGFYDRLTGRQNLEFFAALFGVYGSRARQRISEVLEQAALEPADQPYQELSTGMKQRLLLARTLLHDPQLLLLDEPTRSLDPAEVERFYELARSMQEQEKTLVFTTHRRQDAEALSGRLIRLDHGCLQPEAVVHKVAA